MDDVLILLLALATIEETNVNCETITSMISANLDKLVEIQCERQRDDESFITNTILTDLCMCFDRQEKSIKLSEKAYAYFDGLLNDKKTMDKIKGAYVARRLPILLKVFTISSPLLIEQLISN